MQLAMTRTTGRISGDTDQFKLRERERERERKETAVGKETVAVGNLKWV